MITITATTITKVSCSEIFRKFSICPLPSKYSWVKVKVCLSTPWRHMRSRGIAQLILNLGVRWIWVVTNPTPANLPKEGTPIPTQ